MRNLINEVDWSALFSNLTITDAAIKFYAKLLQLFDESVPNKTAIVNNHPKYFDKHLTNLKNRTNKASKSYKGSGRDTDYAIFSDLKELKAYSCYAYKKYIE